ncbi:MAG: archease, partial [Planctomycetota bacterium]
TQRFLPAEADVRFDEQGGLRATVRGERFDPQRHRPGHEVKAITYHGLKVEQRDGEWLGDVIVDI